MMDSAGMRMCEVRGTSLSARQLRMFDAPFAMYSSPTRSFPLVEGTRQLQNSTHRLTLLCM